MKNNTSQDAARRDPERKLRLIRVIAWKDIQQAFKNKNSLAVLITALAMIFVYYYMPVISDRGDPPLVHVYDEDQSGLVARMEHSETLNVRAYDSLEDMRTALTGANIPELGLVIPAGFDENLAENGEGSLQGYILNWVRDRDLEELTDRIEGDLTSLAGGGININTLERVFMRPESGGLAVTAALTVVFITTMVGLLMLPHLMLEEKENRTLDVLRVSPASPVTLVAGKVLAGMFYCLVGSAAVLIFYRWLILDWWLALLAILLITFFTTSVGLFLGSAVNNRSELTLWAWVGILPLLLPVFLVLLEGLVPETVVDFLRFIPTVMLMELMRISVAATLPVDAVMINLAGLAMWGLVGFLMVVVVVRRFDRQPEGNLERQSRSAGSRDRWQTGALSVPENGMDGRGRKDHLDQQERTPGIWTRIRAIAMKDIAAMIKNKLVISIILGSAFVMLSASALPLLTRLEKRPSVLVYDPGQSTTIRELAAEEDIRVGFSDSRQEMEDVVSGSPDFWIGLVVPVDFDQQLESGHPVILTAYLPHWVNAHRAGQKLSSVDERLRKISGGAASIQAAERCLYPPPEIQGQTQIFTMTFSIVLFTFGIALVPLLMLEEKQSHTLDVLLVSPASFLEVVIGKAAAGLFYCLLASAVVLLFNQHLVVHWGIALLAVFLGSILAVSLGLLIGQLSDNPATISLWGSVILLGMMVLTMLGLFSRIVWPTFFQLFLNYLPTTALVRLLGFSLAGSVPAVEVWINAGVLIVFVVFTLGITSRVMRRLMR